MARNERAVKVINDHGPLGWIFFMAYIGAAVYFYHLDPTFGGFIMALLKAAGWPAFVLYEVLGVLQVK